jgi:uncharacterized protein YecT (DUF1311 family)
MPNQQENKHKALLNRMGARWLCGLLSLLATIAVTPARADGKCSFDRHSQEYQECVVHSFTEELTSLQSALDAYYQKQLTDFPPHLVSPSPGQLVNDTSELKEKFAKAHFAWNEYVAALCAYEGSSRGATSSLVQLYTAHCLIRETKARLEFLQHLQQEPR